MMRLDSTHIQEKEAEWRKNARKRTHGRERLPVYTARDAQRALQQLRPMAYGDDALSHPALRCVASTATPLPCLPTPSATACTGTALPRRAHTMALPGKRKRVDCRADEIT